MDRAFNDLNVSRRATFLQTIMRSLGCSYICLWSYLPTNSCLHFKDGYYLDRQPTTSSGSLASRLFDQYRQQLFFLSQKDLIPGLAFQNTVPYMEFNELDLLVRASNDIQRQFYQEARIKTAVFMGFNSGEIELGFSNINDQLNIEMEIRNLFPDDFSRQLSPAAGELLRPSLDPNLHNSSSSSSFRSPSTESPEYSSLLFNINPVSAAAQTSYKIPELTTPITNIEQALRPITNTTMSMPMSAAEQQTIQALNQIRSTQLPTLEIEQAEITRAILAVLSSSHHQNPPSDPPNPTTTGVFKKYSTTSSTSRTRPTNLAPRSSMFKRSISYYKNLNIARLHERMQGNRPSSTQLHHMISERKRREKQNESFQALRSLLPAGSKKDKASVLTTTRDYLTSLRTQIAELSERNRILEAQLLAAASKDSNDSIFHGHRQELGGSSNNERVEVTIRHLSESTSSSSENGLTVELRVSVRGECSAVDLLIRILEYLKKLENHLSFVSMEANHRTVDSTTISFRLKIQGREWDESSFREAVKRVVNDFTQIQ